MYQGQVQVLDDTYNISGSWFTGSYSKVIDTKSVYMVAVQVIASGAAPGTGSVKAYGLVQGVFAVPSASGTSVNFYGPGLSGSGMNIMIPDTITVAVSGAANFRVITWGRAT